MARLTRTITLPQELLDKLEKTSKQNKYLNSKGNHSISLVIEEALNHWYNTPQATQKPVEEQTNTSVQILRDKMKNILEAPQNSNNGYSQIKRDQAEMREEITEQKTIIHQLVEMQLKN